MSNYSQILYAARRALDNFRHRQGEGTLDQLLTDVEQQFPDKSVAGTTVLKALLEALYDSTVGVLGARNDLDMLKDLVQRLSDGKLAAYPTLDPTSTAPQWVSQIQPLVEITLQNRIDLMAVATKQLSRDPSDRPNPLTIHQRHRLELWAAGLVPVDMHALTQSTTIQGQVLALPRWEFSETCAPGEEHIEHMFITHLPHLFWGDSTAAFAQLIAEQLAFVYMNPEPSDCAITDAVFAAVVLGLEAGVIALGSGDVEDIRRTDGFVFFINTADATVTVDPKYACTTAQTLDAESIRPHGQSLAQAQERQAQRMNIEGPAGDVDQ